MQGLSNHFLSDEHDIDHHYFASAAPAAASAFDYSSLLLEDFSNNDRVVARWSDAFLEPDDHLHRHQQHRDDLAEIVEDNVVAFNSRTSADKNKSGGNSSLHQSEDANLDYQLVEKCISFNAREEQGKNSEYCHEKRRFAAALQHNDQLMLIRDSSTEKRFDTIDRIIPPPQYPSSTTNMSSAKHMFYTANALQLTKDEEDEEEGKAAAKKKVRRNMRISKDPQSVAARHRRERISQKIRILQRLVPGGTKMDTASMLEEAIQYVKFLKTQVQSLEMLGFAAEAPPAAAISSKNNCINS